MGIRRLGTDVFSAGLDRIVALYQEGHEVIVSFSAGKDSGVVLELAILAAKMTGRLPVKVVMRDEEIMFPGTFEYSERVAARKDEVEFHWQIANQPVVNVFNRRAPYFWVFDPELKPEQWVRQPPSYAYQIPEKHIQGMVTRDRFPASPGKSLVTMLGMRASESINRKLGIHSSKGYITKPTPWGARMARPIYDWDDSDVWRAIRENRWDYNNAYDVYTRFGISRRLMRIAPPTLTAAGVGHLGLAAKAWPKWFNKVCERLEGVRTAAQFGRHAVEPIRRQGEQWSETFQRECVDRAPEWIATRAIKARDEMVQTHSKHSAQPFPEVASCPKCGLLSSWKALSKVAYMGDPFGIKTGLTPIEPEFFRPGAGTWSGGKPTW
ncbi:MAG: hypothetical protein ACREDR_00190 [Blastocatellia bacterium]